jgi:hypothetical protein
LGARIPVASAETRDDFLVFGYESSSATDDDDDDSKRTLVGNFPPQLFDVCFCFQGGHLRPQLLLRQ